MDLAYARDRMVAQQLRTWEVLDRRILDLIERLPREAFVPEGYRAVAYADLQIPLGDGQVMMDPKVEGRLLQTLDLRGDERVLEIGTGSGYLTACLAGLARTVESLELRPEFLARAEAALSAAGVSNAVLQEQDALLLDASDAYDAVVVTGATPSLHQPFLEALRIGGTAFMIVGEAPAMEAVAYRRVAEDQWSRESLFETVVPLLDGSDDAPGFRF